MNVTEHKNELNQLFLNENDLDILLNTICKYLKSTLKNYNWVGFYFKNGNKNELKLRTYEGKETDHIIIPFGKGICGQVALSNENFVVDDVRKETNYIACSIDVKSEIVIPIFNNDENIGQIDIDSNVVNAFTDKDVELLEFICDLIGKKIENK